MIHRLVPNNSGAYVFRVSAQFGVQIFSIIGWAVVWDWNGGEAFNAVPVIPGNCADQFGASDTEYVIDFLFDHGWYTVADEPTVRFNDPEEAEAYAKSLFATDS